MRRACPVIALVLLAGCQRQAASGKPAAAAEVLPGSASDAMIAYDTLKSQPPAAIPTPDDAPRPRSGASSAEDLTAVGASDAPLPEPAAAQSLPAPTPS